MDLKVYFDLYQLLKEYRERQADSRDFGLEHSHLKSQPLAQLKAWVTEHQERLSSPRLSETWSAYLYTVGFILVMLALFLGFATGLGLLQYNGDAPVNLIYFLFVAVLFPLFTMSLSLIAMWRASYKENVWVHLSPSFWMEKILRRFSKEPLTTAIPLEPTLLNWMVIQRSQHLALAFSLGLLLALLVTVATQDVAFAWSTTLQVSIPQFTSFIEMLSLPWSPWFDGASPSVALIEQSHYFRLGGTLSQEMLQHRASLGEWWKFLALATFFYAIVLRLFFSLLAKRGVQRALERVTLQLEGVEVLLEQMNTPLVTTIAPTQESIFVPILKKSSIEDNTLLHAHVVQGWGFSLQELRLMCDTLAVKATQLYEVGGNNTLEEDEAIVEQSTGDILLFVKAWEPPTMDCIDFIEALSLQVKQVEIIPMGTLEEGYVTTTEKREIWERKLQLFDWKNVTLNPHPIEEHLDVTTK